MCVQLNIWDHVAQICMNIIIQQDTKNFILAPKGLWTTVESWEKAYRTFGCFAWVWESTKWGLLISRHRKCMEI